MKFIFSMNVRIKAIKNPVGFFQSNGNLYNVYEIKSCNNKYNISINSVSIHTNKGMAIETHHFPDPM